MNPDNLSPEELAKLRKLLNSDESAPELPKEAAKTAEKSVATKTRKRTIWYRNKIIVVALAFVTAVLLAVIYIFAVEPWLALKQAENDLNKDKPVAAVIGGNSEILSFTPEEEGDILAGANPKQLALGENGEITTPSYFEFRSENTNENSHVLDLYLDFYSQKSRDIISLNQTTFTNFIGAGDIILRVHPVVATDGFSVFAPEALAEVMGTNPQLAWNFFVSLMKNSDSLLDSSNTENPNDVSNQEIIDFIAKISLEAGVPTGSPDGVDADSIKYLSFFSWLYAGSRDERLAVGYYPPILYTDGVEVDQEDWVLTDPDAMVRLLASLK